MNASDDGSPRESPLDAALRRRGGVLAPYEGFLLAGRFNDPAGEYYHATETVGVIDQTYRDLYSIRGHGAAGFLQRLVTSDVSALADGEGQPSCFLTPKGKLLAAFHLFRLGEEEFLAFFAGPVPPNALRSLERYAFLEDIAIADEGNARRMITVQGPRAIVCLRHAHFEIRDPPARFWLRARVPFRGEEIFVREECRSVDGGLTLEIPLPALEAAWEALVTSATDFSGGPVGWSTEEDLRIHAGIPRWGVDFDGSNFPNESGWDGAISYKKGCYIGQEVIARMRTYGHANRKLLHLHCPDRWIVDRDTKVYRGGKEVGRITSVAQSPARRTKTALAYLRPEVWEPDTLVAIGTPEAAADAPVANLPIIEPPAPGQEEESRA